MTRLKPDEKILVKTKTPGGEQQLNFITESGLYRLVTRSRKEEAEVFKDWIFEEVLPSIRKTGEYKNPELSKQEEVKFLESVSQLLVSIDFMDDRARALIGSAALNLVAPGAAREEEEWSISRRVQHLAGRSLSSKRDKALLCQLGREMAAAYREKRDAEPPVRSQFVDGTLREVKQYTTRDFEEFGDAIIAQYF